MSWAAHAWALYPPGILAGYLIGAIPFGYLVFYAVKGVDIRTVGSGNIGATNVGRNLGFRFFVLVFLLDVLKGLAPTAGIPRALKALGMSVPADLAVYIAIAAVLGHNFPVYLRFKGGKGVATSLGSLLALDLFACGAAAVGFFLVFLPTRYVSLSSIAGALAFAAGHFARTAGPWNSENLAMSLLSIAIPTLLLVRHHKNLGRILQGTEPKVPLRRKAGAVAANGTDQPGKPGGRVHPFLLMGVAALCAFLACCGLLVQRRLSQPIEVVAGPWVLRETHREQSGQQRATRVAFAPGGRQLAVLCPRYNKVLLYDVTASARLALAREIEVPGRPVALALAAGRLVVLQRPLGDDKHLAQGWWDVFRLEDGAAGVRVPAGYYPDDLAVTPDGRHVIVLNSGSAEGDSKKPLPGIDVFPLAGDETIDPSRPVGHLDLEPGDDADRLFLSAAGTRLLVTLPHAKQAVAIDLQDPAHPRRAGRTELSSAGTPYLSIAPDGDWMIMPTVHEAEAVALAIGGQVPRDDEAATTSRPASYLVYTRPDDSALELARTAPLEALGQFPLKGPLNFAGTRPSGIAFSPERGLIAVATKPGTVHLVSITSRLESGTAAVKKSSQDARPLRIARSRLSEDGSRSDDSEPTERGRSVR